MKKNFLPTIFSLERYPIPEDILVIGCGGTGAFVIAHLARFLSVFNDNRVRRPNLYIADGDIVEEKNLIRQHFIARDIGRNKAEVLAERYAAAFGIQINIIPSNIEKAQDFPRFSRSSNLIIGCVDNNASRQLIHKTYFLSGGGVSTFWVDSGNEETNGQVVCGLSLPRYLWTGVPINTQTSKPKSVKGMFSLPCVTEFHPEILKEKSKFNSELSCAERAISAPQNMMTNVTAATLVMNYAQNIISGLPLTSHGTEFSIKNNFQTRLNTKENLSKVNKDR